METIWKKQDKSQYYISIEHERQVALPEGHFYKNFPGVRIPCRLSQTGIGYHSINDFLKVENEHELYIALNLLYMSLMGVIDCGAHDVSNNKIFSATHTSCTTGLSLRSGQLAEKLFLAVRKMLTIVDLIKVIHLEVRLEYLG